MVIYIDDCLNLLSSSKKQISASICFKGFWRSALRKKKLTYCTTGKWMVGRQSFHFGKVLGRVHILTYIYIYISQGSSPSHTMNGIVTHSCSMFCCYDKGDMDHTGSLICCLQFFPPSSSIILLLGPSLPPNCT